MKKIKKSISDLMNLFSSKQKKYFVILVLLMIFAAMLETLATALMLPLMNVILSNMSYFDSDIMTWLYQTIGNNNRESFLVRMTLIIAMLYLVKGIMSYVNNNLQQRYVAQTRKKTADKLFKAFINKPYSFHLSSTTSDMQRAVITDVEWLCFFVSAFMTLSSEFFVLLIMCIALLFINPMITIAAFFFLLGIMIFITAVISKKVKKAGEKNRLQNIEMLTWVQQTIGGLKSILVNNRKEYFINGFKRSVDEYAKYNCEYQTIFALPRIIMESITMAGIFAIMSILIGTMSNVETLLPTLATFAVAAIRLIPSAKRISDSLNQMKYYAPSIEQISNTLNSVEIENAVKQTEGTLKGNDLGKDICISNITFGFPDSDKNLYNDFSLNLPLKKSIAFIGGTGSGKTTLADIILGLHRPKSGSVKVRDESILNNKDWWAQQIGYIPQIIYLCDDTIKNNVAFGIPNDKIDESKVWRALEEAQLDEYVKSLPNGINTITGENGIRLSGGQRQRIGIARALYSNPQILVLDEATSALDNDTEKAIMQSINYLSKEKTLIIIAHRLTTIEKCDFIYKIENGMAECVKYEDIINENK